MPNSFDYNELFGLTEEPNSGSDVAAAEAAAEAEETGAAEDAQSISAAENSMPEETGEEEPLQEEADGEPAVDEGKKPQSKKENARFAAARRKAEAETEAAVARAREEEKQRAQQEMDRLIASANLTNPYTKKPVTNREEWDAWQKQHAEESRRAAQDRMGMTDEDMDAFVRSLPEVRQAEADRAEAQAVLRQAQQERIQITIENELAVIRKYDPAVQTLADIERTDESKEILTMVQRGYSLSDAWRLTHYDAVMQQKADKARQAAGNAARGKEHLLGTRSRGKGSASVPGDVREMYRALDPAISDEEISRHYNGYVNRR